MTRIIILPQQPLANRYTYYFADSIKDFLKSNFEVEVLSSDTNLHIATDGMFFVNQTIIYELKCIEQLLNMDISDDDILFICDPSFPGFTCNLRTYFTKNKIVAYVHATSINYLDIFENLQPYKWNLERSFLNTCDLLLVATYYHKAKLMEYGITSRIEVVSFPLNPYLHSYKMDTKKIIDMLIPFRNTPQKIDYSYLEKLDESGINPLIKYYSSLYTYYQKIQSAYVVASLAREETFGLAIAEAYTLGVPILAPNRLAYKELYPQCFLYDSPEEMIEKYNDIRKDYDKYLDIVKHYPLEWMDKDKLVDIVKSIINI